MKIRHILTIGVLGLCMSITGIAFAQSEFTPAQKTAIQKIIRSYLISNPQVLVDASQALQAQQLVKMQSSAVKGAQQNAAALFRNKNDIVKGNLNGAITLVEFFDYQCPICRTMEPFVENVIKANPDLRVVYKVFPVHGANSVLGAQAAYAAYKQGKYVAFHDEVMKSKIPVNPTTVQKFAKKAGLNMSQFNKDLKQFAPTVKKMISANMKLVQALRLNGTPTFITAKTNANATSHVEVVIGGVPQSKLQSMIDAVRK